MVLSLFPPWDTEEVCLIKLFLFLAQRTDFARREARTKLSRRPWRVDTFDELTQKWFSCSNAEALPDDGVPHSPFRRVIMFVDNAGELVIRFQKALISVPGQPILCKGLGSASCLEQYSTPTTFQDRRQSFKSHALHSDPGSVKGVLAILAVTPSGIFQSAQNQLCAL